MTQCPLCAAVWPSGYLRCECGYDSHAAAKLETLRSVWRRRRHNGATMLLVGFAVFAIVPGVAATVGGLFAWAGAVAVGWSTLQLRSTERQLRAARTRNALPEARVV